MEGVKGCLDLIMIINGWMRDSMIDFQMRERQKDI